VHRFNLHCVSVLREQGSSDRTVAVCEAEEQIFCPLTSRLIRKWLNAILELNGLLCVSRNMTYHTRLHRFLSPGERVSDLEVDLAEVDRVSFLQELNSRMSGFSYYKGDGRVPKLVPMDLHVVTLRLHLLEFLREL